jgi:hypothetical protein
MLDKSPLVAVEALKNDADGKAVVTKMKELPTDDKAVRQGHGMCRCGSRGRARSLLFVVPTARLRRQRFL